MGEQGARIVFEDLATREVALAAAAGWGGDRLVLALKGGAPGEAGAAPGAGAAAVAAPAPGANAGAAATAGARREYALAWRLRFDTPADAREAARVLEGRLGKSCRLRPDLGPLAWASRGSDVAVVAGPYERAGRTARGTGTCATATVWLTDVLKAPVGAP
jgi:hypothetical protein